MKFRWLGLQNYLDVDKGQRSLVPEILDSKNIFIIGTEFRPVLTLGLRGKAGEDFLIPPEDLKKKSLEVVRTDRGGQATIHGPGQLIIYPMLDLSRNHLGVKDFVQLLMTTTVRTLENIGIEAFYDKRDPGVYTASGKIAFCGLKIDRGVVRHGISINVRNDLSLFEGVRSCGISQPKFDLVSHHVPTETENLFNLWCRQYEKDFCILNKPETAPKNKTLDSDLSVTN